MPSRRWVRPRRCSTRRWSCSAPRSAILRPCPHSRRAQPAGPNPLPPALAPAPSLAPALSLAPTSQVRFHEGAGGAPPLGAKPQQLPPLPKPAAEHAKAAEKPADAAGKGKEGSGSKPSEPEPKELTCDATAEWARAENLTASLVRQRTDNPDDVFHPLPHQRTCELTDIFSAPRRRERGKGSGEWTPVAPGEAARALFHGSGAERPPPPEGTLQLLGVEGEYMGESVQLPSLLGAASGKLVLVGRSSSCDVTLSRDDQISRRHVQIEARDGGKSLFVRDLGSTYGTKLNGKVLGAESVQISVGDVLVLGASTFHLQPAK